MLRDRFFYPLAVLVIAAIIAVALSFGEGEGFSDQQIIAEGWELSGPDLNALTISPGSNGAYVDEDGGYIQLSQFTPDGEGPASIGVFATLGPAHERAFAGRPLRLTFRARAGRINPLKKFEVAYYPMEGAPSGWTSFELSPDWQVYTVNYSPPIIDAMANVDLIAIFPGRAGESKTVDLSLIKVEVLPEPNSD
ncbi:hypothetical protein GCM10009069_18950 [Algimonas arctica]|uniref:Uncharacterized protein n=1 Tax=Algimonas arctica TaxID=1479486 RepID=A0A8J3CQW2_9PROT|nr:hypothetical protein [Algimonas arctica]GHA96171.1 hypothetical protein GCM10009069_18950 [Algimonas arctica]